MTVVEHSSFPPDPWSGYKLCLQGLPDTTHVLILQDDAIPVEGFWPAVQQIAESNPDTPVCLWMSSIPSDTAARARRAWGKQVYVPLGPAPFVPLVAVLWPIRLATEFREWSNSASGLTRADDGNVARWKKQTGQQFRVCVPSIVEHDDFVESVKGGPHKPSGGRDRMRVASLLAENALDYDW